MRLVPPYSSLQQAMEALDNGGRFYHWASHARDELVTAAELRKEAKILARDNISAMFFAVATSKLSDQDRARLNAKLADDAREVMAKFGPRRLSPSAFQDSAEQKGSYLLEGEVRVVEDEARLGFVPVTTMVNNVPMTTSTPVGKLYTVYELDGVANCEVLVSKRCDLLSGRVLFAGGLKQCSIDKKRFAESKVPEFWRLDVGYASVADS
ncbi:MAG: hypothetical protein AAF196_07665 [Planctomycetota bacterium]